MEPLVSNSGIGMRAPKRRKSQFDLIKVRLTSGLVECSKISFVLDFRLNSLGGCGHGWVTSRFLLTRPASPHFCWHHQGNKHSQQPKKKKEKNWVTRSQRGGSGHLAVAGADKALQVPTGGGLVQQLLQGEAEAAAFGARGWRAGLHHDGQLLHHGPGVLGAHHASAHFHGEDEFA